MDGALEERIGTIIEIHEVEAVHILVPKKMADQLLAPGAYKQKSLDRHSLKNINNVETLLVTVYQIAWDRQGTLHPGAIVLQDLENKGT